MAEPLIELAARPAMEDERPAFGPAPFSLTAAEWAVVFPRPQARDDEFTDRLLPEPDVPEAGIPDHEELLDCLRALGMWSLERQERLIWNCAPFTARGPYLFQAMFVFALLIVMHCSIWTLNDGTFATGQIAAGLVAMCELYLSATGILIIIYVRLRGVPEPRSQLPELLAVLVRWHELVGSSKDVETGTSPFLVHRSGDGLCTCEACFTGTAKWLPWEHVARTVPMHCLTGFIFIAMAWTPLVYYEGPLWSVWWGILLGTLLMVSIAVYMASASLNRWNSPSIVLTNLQTRAYHRASTLALASLVLRAKHDLLEPPPPTQARPPTAGSLEELYARLHAGYTTIWQRSHRSASDFITLLAFLGPIGIVVAIVIFIATGNCIPLFTVIFALVFVWMTFNDLLHLPVANAQIDAVATLYAGARQALHSLLAQAAKLPPHPDRAAVAEQVLGHARLLQTFEEVGRLRATFVGVPVTWGLAKTFLVTMLTLAIGLWSVLKGAGVAFTVQSVCPIQT
ncbi:hypothetical protein DFJ74DRAFT_10963 [Hyaloraphidium curvatum]|nr:hypothetical protein DFJ74DRAFT_10963 [Hyaloraphidium curvatum]